MITIKLTMRRTRFGGNSTCSTVPESVWGFIIAGREELSTDDRENAKNAGSGEFFSTEEQTTFLRHSEVSDCGAKQCDGLPTEDSCG